MEKIYNIFEIIIPKSHKQACVGNTCKIVRVTSAPRKENKKTTGINPDKNPLMKKIYLPPVILI